MKYLIRVFCLVLMLALVLNFRWVHAATAALVAAPCDPALQSQAQTRVAELFGAAQSQPIVRCLDGPTLGLSISHGSTNFAPRLPAIVLIGPLGNNVDVLAHEWVHAETSHRLGFIRRSFGLPTWVDEGLAMQVDHRTDYNLQALNEYKKQEGLKVPTAESISNTQFFAASDQGKLHYAVSRCAVTAWLTLQPNWLNLLTNDRPTALNEVNRTFDRCK